jgi:phosphoribosyl 1,2-cyclic phosphodiesterase
LVGFEGSEPGAALHPGNAHVIVDAGIGLLSLQAILMRGAWGQGTGELCCLLSHYHWDHIIGIPFFAPLFVKGNRVVFFGAHVPDLRSSIERLFTSAYSPHKGTQGLAAHLEYRRVEPGEMEAGGFRISAVENRHPGACLSFRMRYGPHAVVYSTDHEAGDAEVDSRLIELARGANLWILDAHFTQEERQRRDGWGHSSHLEAVNLALEAGVMKVVLFHHNPDHDDSTLDRMGLEAAQAAAGTGMEVLIARDRMVMDVG